MELIQTNPLILVGSRDLESSHFLTMRSDTLKEIHYCPQHWFILFLLALAYTLVTASASPLWLWYSQFPQDRICWRNTRVRFTSTPSKPWSCLKPAFHIPQSFATVASATIFCHIDPISGTVFSIDCHPKTQFP